MRFPTWRPHRWSRSPRQRMIGEPAKTAETSNFKNTIGSLKRLVGRTLSDPEVSEVEKKFINAQLVDANGTVGVKINYLGEPTTFNATQLVASYLGKLRDTASNELKAPVTDVVIAVPGWYTDVQRRAVLDGAKIAGLNALRLINDTTAVALGYGITKSDLPENPADARNICFVDIGHADYSASVVAFSKGQLTVKGTAYDRHFGGRDFDYALIQHFAEEFKQKYKIDVMSNPKAIFRLSTSAERLKKILSANTEGLLNVESIMNDVDASSSLKREDFEKLSAHLLERVTVPVQQAIEEAGLTVDQIDAIELVGGSTRIPAIKERLLKFFGEGKVLSTTLNADEAICRGATFACATLSPVFRVREFAVNDINRYAVKVTWEKEEGNPDEDTELLVFPRRNAIPSTKVLTFHRAGPFELEAKYAEDAGIPEGINPWIGKVMVKNVQKTASGELACVKVKVRMNLHGILSFEEAYTVEEVEEEETYTVGEGEEKKEETRKVRKVKRTGECPIVGGYGGFTPEVRDQFFEEEGKMASSDKLVVETEERKNALEEYVYDTRGKLDGRYAPFVQADEKEKLLAGLQNAEDWLYSDEGDDATKSAYVEKLNELKKIGDPIYLRWKENDERPKAAAALRETVNHWMEVVQSGDEKYSHISDANKEKVIEKCATNQKWLEDNLVRQSEKPKNVNPIITSKEILARRDDVQFSSAGTMNIPKPKVTKTEEAPKKEADVDMDKKEAPQEEMDVD